MDYIKEIIVAVFIFMLTGLMGYIATQVKNFNNKDKLSHDAVVALLKDRIYQKCDYHIEQDFCDNPSREVLGSMFFIYHDGFKQNGAVEDIYKECLALPRTKGGKPNGNN